MPIDPRRLRPSELCRLVNSTPLGTVLDERQLHRHRHQAVVVPDYDYAPIDDQHWSVVLLDHEPPARRGIDLERLLGKSDLVIAHDSQHEAYGYRPFFERFKYRYDYTRLVSWTTVVSDVDPLDWLDEALRPLW